VAIVRSLGRRLADDNSGYVLSLAVGIIALLIMLLVNEFSFQTLYTSETVTQLLILTGVVMRFLSGFGIMLTYASLCVFVFRKLSDQVKGSKKRLTVLKIVFLLPIIAILVYAASKLTNTLVYSQQLSLIELVIAVYGVWSLMLMVYGIPVALGRYNPNARKGMLEKIGERVDRLKHSLWSGYQSYIWQEYGKVYSVEFERYRKRLTEIRAILSAILLLPIALVLMLLPPLGILSIALWFRGFSLDYKPFSRLERTLLMSVVIVVALVTTYLFLVIEIAGFVIYFDFSYAIGIFLSIALLGFVIWKS
jgi:hypothetical protein